MTKLGKELNGILRLGHQILCLRVDAFPAVINITILIPIDKGKEVVRQDGVQVNGNVQTCDNKK